MWRHEIQIAIMRRRAAMARAVLPRLTAIALWLLTGHTDAMPSSGGREEPLDEDADWSNDDDGSLDLDGAESLNEGAVAERPPG
jgi:hypothetical protein